MMKTLTVAASAAILTAFAAPGAAAQERDCFHANSVNGWSTIDDDTIRVDVGVNRQYALHTVTDADELRWDMGIAIRSPSGFICTGGGPTGVEIYSLDPNFRRVWMVSEITRLPAETAGSGQLMGAERAPMPMETAQAPMLVVPQQSAAAAALQAQLGLDSSVPIPMEVLRVIQRGDYTSHDLQRAWNAALRAQARIAAS